MSGVATARSTLGHHSDLSFRSPGEGVQDVAIWIDVAKCELLFGNGEMTEAIHLLCKGAALRALDLEVVQIRSAASREEVAGGVPLKFQMLQVVVVSRKIP
jgi:hypothetical protein